MEGKDTDSNDSHDFWERFDQDSIALSIRLKKFAEPKRLKDLIKSPKKKKTENPQLTPPDYESLSKNEYMVEHLNDSVARIKESNIEGMKIMRILIKNQTRKELLNTVVNIQQKFQQDVFQMKLDRELMQEDYSSKTRLMNNLMHYLFLQIFINEEFNVREPEPVEFKSLDEAVASLNHFKALFEGDTVRFEVARILNAEHKEEAAIAAEKVEAVNREIKKIKHAHSLQVKALENTIGQREQAAIKETFEIKREFEAYKDKIMTEMHLRSLVEERQKKFIAVLVEELRNAKVILQNPTLRMKMYEKVRESLTPVMNESIMLPRFTNTQLSTKENDGRAIYTTFDQSTSRSTKSNRRAKSSFKP